jgi:hypothetical protein
MPLAKTQRSPRCKSFAIRDFFAFLAAWREIALVPAEGRARFIGVNLRFHFTVRQFGDCRVASLLAMTGGAGESERGGTGLPLAAGGRDSESWQTGKKRLDFS